MYVHLCATKARKIFQHDNALAKESGTNIKSATNQAIVIRTIDMWLYYNSTADKMVASVFSLFWLVVTFRVGKRGKDGD